MGLLSGVISFIMQEGDNKMEKRWRDKKIRKYRTNRVIVLGTITSSFVKTSSFLKINTIIYFYNAD